MNLAQMRARAGITQAALGRCLSVSSQTVWYWESGRVAPAGLAGAILTLFCRVCESATGAAEVAALVAAVNTRESWEVTGDPSSCGAVELFRRLGALALPSAPTKKAARGKSRTA